MDSKIPGTVWHFVTSAFPETMYLDPEDERRCWMLKLCCAVVLHNMPLSVKQNRRCKLSVQWLAAFLGGEDRFFAAD